MISIRRCASSICRSALASAAISLLLVAHAQPRPEPNLVVIGEVDQGELSIDLNSIAWDSPTSVTATLLFAPSLINEARKAGANLIRSIAHIDCAANRFYISTWVAFKTNGETVNSGKSPPPANPPPPLTPNPQRDRLISIACKK